jgi:hypothetical protein
MVGRRWVQFSRFLITIDNSEHDKNKKKANANLQSVNKIQIPISMFCQLEQLLFLHFP